MKTVSILNSILVILLIKADLFTVTNSGVNHLKCLVCQKVVEEMSNEVDKVSSKKTMQIGTYGFDNKLGPNIIEYRRSEIFLTELMDVVCDKMDDYARATYKSNGKLIIIPLIKDGKTNPVLGEVDLVADADLNKSLKHYCLQILDEHEEDVLNLFQSGFKDINIELCTRVTKLCQNSFEEKYMSEDWKDEL